MIWNWLQTKNIHFYLFFFWFFSTPFFKGELNTQSHTSLYRVEFWSHLIVGPHLCKVTYQPKFAVFQTTGDVWDGTP